MSPLAVSNLGKGAQLLDPEIAQSIAALPKPPPPPAGIDFDQLILGVQPIVANAHRDAASRLPEVKDMAITERTIPAPDGFHIPIRIYTPQPGSIDGSSGSNGHATQTYPVTVYLHAGGFCFGSLDTEEAACRAICGSSTPSVVVNVAYRLAPTHRWPTAEEDCWEALKWVVASAGVGLELRQVDLQKGLVLGGASAGANITCKLVQRTLVEPLMASASASPIRITGQLLIIPMTISHWPEPSAADIDTLEGVSEEEKLILKEMKSYSDEEGHPDFAGLPVGRIPFAMYNDVYKPEPSPLTPESSPLFAPSSVFAQLPRAFIQVAGADPLKDDGIAYAKRLQANGVEARLEIFEGAPHAFYEFAPECTLSLRRLGDLARGFGWVIGCGENQ